MAAPSNRRRLSKLVSHSVISKSAYAPRLSALAIALALALNNRVAIADLPVPSSNFIHAGEGIAVMQSDGINMQINQASDLATLNWDSFNIGSENSVIFNQPGSGSIAINRIFQNDPSKILGALSANGQVYLYNQNGIIFGEGARINTATLVATTLDFDINKITSAIDTGEPAFFDLTGNNAGIIEIMPGAEINATDPNGGRILVIASKLINSGTLNSPDGQTILAASSDKVYLAVSDKDPSLRGLLVEVQTGGSVTNLGSIIADRGNISLVGLAVNQMGHVRATTSVDKNGSIRLLARDNVTLVANAVVDTEKLDAVGIEGGTTYKPTASFLAVAQRSGTVVLGPDSVTEVAPDSTSLAAVPDAQEQLQSKVEIVGNEVWMQKDASIVAASGKIKITATDKPANPLQANTSNNSYVYLDEGSLIDVSGTDTTVLPMERNSLEVEVRSNELANSPLQRGGVLNGQKVFVDLRTGTDIIDYSGALANVNKTLSERLSAGGDIVIRSEGDVVQHDGSVMDISGGTVNYESGYIKESQLISQGRVYSLSEADKNRSYNAILGVEVVEHERWSVTETFDSFTGISSGQYVKGFVEGKAAGSINITAASTLLAADGVRADVTLGPYQRDPALLPDGGVLDIDLRDTVDRAQNVRFLAESVVDPITDELSHAPDPVSLQRDAIDSDLLLPDTYLKNSGLAVLRVTTNGDVVVEQSAVLAANPGTSIDLTGSNLTVNGAIINHSGDVSLAATPVTDNGIAANLVVGEHALIDTSGLWVNDVERPGLVYEPVPVFKNGGDITLSAEGGVPLGEGSLLNASGGAWLDSDFAISAGKGGDISLVAHSENPSVSTSVKLNGKLQSYAMFEGGKLNIETSSIVVSDDPSLQALPDQLVLDPSLFNTGGFSKYSLSANAGDFIIDSNIRPQAQNLVLRNTDVQLVASTAKLSDNILLAVTGTPFQSLTNVATLPDALRHPVDLDFALSQVAPDTNNTLVLAPSASIEADPGAAIRLSSDTSIYVEGSIDAPGGNISLTTITPAVETGFLANQGIWLGNGSRISALSDFILTPNEQGLRVGQVIDAGTVSLTANRGYVIIQDGAAIDVSAQTVTLDMLAAVPGQGTQYQAVDVAPDAGNINITAAEGIFIDGDLHADAADAAGASGGSLEIGLNLDIRGIVKTTNNALGGGLVKFNFNSRDIVITQDAENILADSLQTEDAIDNALNGIAYVDSTKIVQGGFDSVRLSTSHTVDSASEIRFASDVTLSLANTLELNAPTINLNSHKVDLQAAYMSIGTAASNRNAISTDPVLGSGTLSLNASLIDIIGDVDITKLEHLVFNTSQDVRFIGAPSSLISDQLHGALNTAADIDITARQIYPVTSSHAAINLVNNPAGIVTLNRIGTDTPVLSAAGSLDINAPVINQGGVIKAPLGNIVLNAADEIHLLPGSLTSVSAEGLVIPYGATINAGSSWDYDINGNIIPAELPEKSVDLVAPNIDLQTGSVVDLSGGGDAVAWEYVSGPGGKTDVLLVDNGIDNTAGAFAILPQSGNQYAPYDVLLNNDNFATGDRVYLSAANGLDAGFYTILPARYALLPGAKLVTPVSGINNIYPGKTITRADGTAIVPGKYGVANTEIIDSTWSAFVIEDGSIARTRSEYIDTYASNYFTAHSPADAGALVVDSIVSLMLEGSVIGDHAEGALGSRVDILADNIEVVASSGVVTSGFIQLTDDALNNLTVDSIMLGGRRNIITDTETEVSVRSNQVVVREGAQLESPELLLVAKDNIELKSGAALSASGGASNEITNTLALDNNASLLGVSVNPLANVTRTGTSAGSQIVLGDQATLASDNSMIIDSSGDVLISSAGPLATTIRLNGGALRLGAKQINLGTIPENTAGFNLSDGLLAGLDVSQLNISSSDSIAIYGNLDISFANLELIAPGINSISAADASVSLNATGRIEISQNGQTALANGTGGGELNLRATEIAFNNNQEDFVIDGFDNVNIVAGEKVNARANDSGVFDFRQADINVDTPLLTGEAGSKLSILTTGIVDLINSTGTVVDTAAIQALGGQLEIDASSVSVDTSVIFPSGLIALNSTGTAADVSLNANAVLDVSGRTVEYVDGSQAGSSGGRVELTSENGSIHTASGSRINLAASAVAGDAGQLDIAAHNGTLALGGEINTTHSDGFAGAGFSVDVAQLADIPALLRTVQAEGFTRSQDYRIRNGDIVLDALAGGAANIRAGRISLVADNGQINISGVLDASGDQAGKVGIFASGDVLLNGADIDASATADTKGGTLVIGTTSGVISADDQTQINLAGANSSDTGKLTLRAPRTDANSDVAINNFSATVDGAERIDIEGVAVYNDSTIGSAQQNTYRDQATSWLGNVPAMIARLGLDTDNRVHVISGVEVANAGDITIANPVDFYQWQADSGDVIDSGTFTVRAGDNLNINASISDAISVETLYQYDYGGGFIFYGPVVPVLKPGDSWNYRLVSGADLGAASPMATVSDNSASTGNLKLASAVAVRTGTGAIDIASGGNLVLTDQTSVIYTAGSPNDTGLYDNTNLDFSGLPDGPQFPDHGGDIRIKVAGDINAAASNQFFTDWLQRIGGTTSLGTTPAMWGVVLNDFQQGIATLGGGDITVTAGGDINNLSLSTPRTGQIDNNNDVIIRGGGDIDVTVGGDYLSGRILADGGDATFRVGGKMASAASSLNTLLAVGDARVRIEAGGDIGIEGIGNVTMLPMSKSQSNTYVDYDLASVQTQRSYFFTYGDNSGIDLISHYGDVILNNDIAAINTAPNNQLTKSNDTTWVIYPGNLKVATLTGDISLNHSFSLFPDADANLKLLSARDIKSSDSSIIVKMSDADVALLPSVTNPANSVSVTQTGAIARLIGDPGEEKYSHADVPVHQNDAAPVKIIANRDIVMSDLDSRFILPKQTHIYAGGDITDLAVKIQNLNTSDTSLFVAGGDILYPFPEGGAATASNGIRVTGPGRLDVIAGGSIDLGQSFGIRSIGNVKNFALPQQGADISVYAGLGERLDSSAFIATYFNGDTSGDAALINIDVSAYQQQLINYVSSDEYNGDITTALSAQTSQSYANRTDAIAAFNLLTQEQQLEVALASFTNSPVFEQRGLLQDVMFNEIQLSAGEQASSGDDTAYARGFLAINQLFGSNSGGVESSGGNIILPFSRITTTAGGDINLLAPNGELIVGYTAEVPNVSNTLGALGVIVAGQGNLSALTEGDVSVNLARMLTLDGGDITLWSSSGDIDAGRGAKSQLNIPPPLTVVDKDTQQISVIFPPAVSGSGIGAAAYSPGQTPGKVTLAAPGGVINASDAGIRSDGDIVLAANRVLGGENISAGGVAVGIPVATNVTAGLSGLSSASDSAINSASDIVAGAASGESGNAGVALVTVEYLGAGDE
jgi:filamentous hemagglutinin family protein